jgi:hypothetical protein
VILRRKADRAAALPSSPPDPGQVAALADRLDAVARHSEYGGTLEEFATAALTWMHQQQRGSAP